MEDFYFGNAWHFMSMEPLVKSIWLRVRKVGGGELNIYIFFRRTLPLHEKETTGLCVVRQATRWGYKTWKDISTSRH